MQQDAGQIGSDHEHADEWARVGAYLDRLALENDRLEAELKLKRERRLAREADYHRTERVASPSFNEVAATTAYETRAATETTETMHVSYDALRRDLKGLMSELDDFKSSRAGLAARLGE